MIVLLLNEAKWLVKNRWSVTEWQPKFTRNNGLIVCAVISVITCILTFVGLKFIWSAWYREYKLESDNVSSSYSKCEQCKTRLGNYKHFFTIVVLTIFKFIWDAIDVTIDIYTFVKLENGELISPFIQRNVHVTNGIMVFACLGIVKIPLNIYNVMYTATVQVSSWRYGGGTNYMT